MPTENIRDGMITDNVNYCVDHWEYLTEWEKGFIGTVQNLLAADFTPKRFKKLQEVREDVKQRVWNHIKSNEL